MFRQTITATALLALCSIMPAQAQDVTDYLGVPGPIKVGDTDYVLSWSSNPQPGYFKQEYLPKGAAADSYESMVMVEFLATDAPLTEVVGAQAAMVEQRKGSDPVANYAVFDNPDNGEYLLDFLLSAKDENGEFTLEWNGYRYVEGEFDGQKGSMLFAISERAYGDAASEAFLRNLREFKAQHLSQLTEAELPQLD
ncbi:hypothetical protein DevBK_00650 [Devosia sp. BK]|uniref:hypothetical protein n=1 Tax=Devosia sp. BK TaxID=2871706 RepID=UPI00293AAC19|nr:hypothetical protein [Devosia sp. BK]MDV3249828.1 hypothetical protein [Devosia sp. BK]